MAIAEKAETALQQLTPQEEQILRLRFGIGTRMGEIDDVAASLSLTPTAVHRIECSALRKLRLAAVMEAASELILLSLPGTRVLEGQHQRASAVGSAPGEAACTSIRVMPPGRPAN